jgi:hypothetical protein
MGEVGSKRNNQRGRPGLRGVGPLMFEIEIVLT